MQKIVVANDTADWGLDTPEVTVVSARDYLAASGAGGDSPPFPGAGGARVFNLCRDLRYQSTGYYVSLLAEARGHKPVPSVSTLQDLRSPTVLRDVTTDLDELVQKSLAHLKSDDFTLSIYFGRNVAKHYDALAKRLAALVDAPLLRARFTRVRGRWLLGSIRLVPASDIPDEHRELATEFARAYFGGRRRTARPATQRNDLAVLVNPDEPAPPSNAAALDRFARAAGRLGFATEFITRADFTHLLEFDALLIRETTAVNHHTYRFAARAAREGMPVIDDPASILRCTNKVFLAEVLARHRVPAPPTVIVHRGNRREVSGQLPFPVVLKQPDGAFSQGVVKVENEGELKAALDRLLARSDLAIAQAFTPSGFDWRIGVLDRRPLFACKYFMAPGHWQIYDWGSGADDPSGESEPVPVARVPEPVMAVALKAANLMGDGFYGVDLKETAPGEALVIEVNDNPSVDAGVEDALLGDALYDTIIGSLAARLERKRGAPPGA